MDAWHEDYLYRTRYRYRDSGIRIRIKVDYSFLTTTDLDAILSSIRVPLMKTLRGVGLARRRDRLNLEVLKTGDSIFIELIIIVAGEVLALALWDMIKERRANKQINDNLKKTKRGRKNIRRIKKRIIVEEDVVEEEIFGEEELTSGD